MGKINPKLTDAERHKRFKELAREVDASGNVEKFDEAFNRVTAKNPSDSR